MKKVPTRVNTVPVVVGGLLVALGLAFFVSRFASGSPDGLNKVAMDEGFALTETEHAAAESPLAGYGVKGVDDEGLSTGLSGIIGVGVTFGIGLVVFGLVGRGKAREGTRGGEGDAASAATSSGAAT
jgi:PDGLE domain